MHHTVVISDVHLCEVEPEQGLWMRYRQREHSPAREIAGMVDALLLRVRGDQLTFVLGGDVFDFDAPRVVERRSVFHDLPRTAEHAVPAMRAMLDDHPDFDAAIARVLAAGHTVVVISGNHDVQLTLPEVRDVLRERLVASTLAQLGCDAGGREEAAIRGRIVFRAWFHRTADGVHIEHGNQYDPYCSYRYPMMPFGRTKNTIQPTMGSLATRHLVSRMGYFNPHVDASFMLSPVGYAVHWTRYYLFSRRSLALAWAAGAVRTMAELVRMRHPGTRLRRRANVSACATETHQPRRVIERHTKLFARPAEDALGRVARELWLDRVGVLALSGLVALVGLLLWTGHLALGALAGPALLAAYEIAMPKKQLDVNWSGVSRMAKPVGKLHQARAVVFGHTHHAEGTWDDGVFHGNSGSWSAAFRDIACTEPLFRERPLIWLTSDGEGGELSGGLWAWRDGELAPQSVRAEARAKVERASRRPQLLTAAKA